MYEELRRVALFTSGIAELTRNRAEQVVRDLVRAGDVRREQATTAVKDLMETSRQSRLELVRFVRAEIQAQLASLGLASKRDLERLERRVARLEAARAAAGASKAKSTRAGKTTRTKSAARKTTSKPAGSGDSRS